MKLVSAKSWSLALFLTSALLGWCSLRAEDPSPASEADKKPKRPQPSADRYEAMRAQRDSWTKELAVSDEQREQLRAAMKAQADQGRAIRSDKSLDAAAKREKIKALQGELTAKVKKILTPEQFIKYEKLQEQRRQQVNTRVERQRPREGDRQPTSDKPAGEKTATSETPPTDSADKTKN